MALCQALLDAVLASEQPVHGGVQLILVDGVQLQQVAEGGDGAFGVEGASGGEFGAGIDDASGDHGDDEIAVAGGGTSDEGMEGELAEGTEDGGDVAVGEAAQDGEQFAGGLESDAAFEEDAQTIDEMIGPLGEVGDGAFSDLAVVAEGLAEEDGRGRVAVGDDVDVHGFFTGVIVEYLVITYHVVKGDIMRHNRTIYMDTIYTYEPDKSCHGKYLQERPVKLRSSS